MQITRLSTALGAEVRGIDLDRVTPDDAAAISAHLLEHLVLFFPGQRLSPDGHVALGRRFGELEIHPNLPNAGPDHPEVLQLTATRGGVADEWHTDVTFLPSPSVMSIMHMVTCPDLGGDTMWANQYLAYERLSSPLRDLLDGLHAVHNASPHRRPEMTAMHPVVRIHPETGRRSLMVNEHFTKRIVELSHPESRLLLDYLVRWSTCDEFVVRYRWTPGTVAIWDNRCTQHRVIHDFEGERIIQRVTVLGDRPEGAPSRWEPFTTERFGASSVHDDILRNHLREQATGTSSP